MPSYGPLARALSDGDSAIVDSAVTTLGRLIERKDREALAGIASALSEWSTPEGISRFLARVHDYLDIPEVVKLLLGAGEAPLPTLRAQAAPLLGFAPRTPPVERSLVQLLDDTSVEVKSAALAAYYEMPRFPLVDDFNDIGPPSVTVEAGRTFALLPDEGTKVDAIDLLADVRRAVLTLQDLGLDQGQNRIVDELILPRLDDLSALIDCPLDASEHLPEVRGRFAFHWGGVAAAARALGFGTTGLAQADEAGENIVVLAEKMAELGAEIVRSF